MKLGIRRWQTTLAWRSVMRVATLAAVAAAGVIVTATPPVLAASRGITVDLRAAPRPDAAIVERDHQLYSRSHALVVGIDDYRHWPDLNSAVSDASKIKAALEAKGFDVRIAIGLKKQALERALENFFIDKGADGQARLLVWFAGHGHTLGGEGYLIPSDGARPNDLSSFRRTALSLRRFAEYVRLAESKHVLTVFDSCFSGTIFDKARANPPPAITRATTEPVRQFISSGDRDQQVSDDGTFAQLFVDAITGRRDAAGEDGYLTASELGLFMAEKMANYTNNSQTPMYGKLNDPNWDRGDFVFKLARFGAAGKNVARSPSMASDIAVWNIIKDSSQRGDFDTFIKTYPKSPMVPFARRRLATRSPAASAIPNPHYS